MSYLKSEIDNYQLLNSLGSTDHAAVLFGTDSDRCIPVCELSRAYGLTVDLYNRSLSGLVISEAADAWDDAAAALHPADVLLHLGSEDLAQYAGDPAAFEQDYIALIGHIRAANRNCRITIISLENPEKKDSVIAFNRSLRNIADATRCGFCDISGGCVWNPVSTLETISFVYSTGFVRPLKRHMCAETIVRILYGYQQASSQHGSVETFARPFLKAI